MARPLFTGNYGSGLGNYGMAGQLAAQRGQALGQAFQNVGTSVANAMKDYQVKKEKKDKEQALAGQFVDLAKANPEIAKQMGVDPNDDQALKVAGQAFAKNPESMQLAAQFASMQAQGQRMKLEREDAIRKERLAPLIEQSTLQQLESGKLALGQAKEKQQVSNLATQMVRKPGGGFEIPAPLASTPEAMKALQLRQQQDLARRKAESDILNQESLIEFRKLSAQANVLSQQAAALKAQSASTDVSKKIDGIQKQLDNIQDNPITVRLKNGDKVQRTFRDIVEGKVEDIDPKSESEAFAKWKTIHEGLLEKQLQLYKQILATYYRTNKETGETEVVEGTMAERLEHELALIEQEQEKQKEERQQKTERQKAHEQSVRESSFGMSLGF